MKETKTGKPNFLPKQVSEEKLNQLASVIEQLEKERAFFRQVIDLNPNFIFAKDREGRFTLVNRAVAEAYGTTAEELVGKKDADFNENLQEVEHFRKDDLDVMDSLMEKFIPEEVITDASGKTRWLQTVKRPIIDENGFAEQLLGVATDISDRKKAEEERVKLETQIQHSQKLESLGILAGGIAHDFNNLLMGIVGNADLLLMDLEEHSPHRKKAKHIKAASRRLAELTNQLLAYSGRGAFLIDRVNLSQITDEMVNLLNTIISKKAVLHFNFPRELPTIKADVTQIRQIVMNLITNASDALGKESGEIFLNTGTVEIDNDFDKKLKLIEKVKPGNYVFLEVRDTGCGMEQETLSKIFDPFFTTKFIGHGLGLAAVLGIVRSHKGSLSVDSVKDKGTSIKIFFPTADDENTANPGSAVPILHTSLSKRKTKHILIVDDEITMRSVTKTMLEKFDYGASLATNGNEALIQLRDNIDSFAAVLLDINMPEKDGRETLIEIRKLSKSIPVILTSGYTALDATKDFPAGSFSAFIQKPFGPKELIETILSVT